MNPEVKEVKTDNEIFKCPSCGSNMSFDPVSDMLSCSYCGHKIAIDGKTNEKENDFFALSETDNSWAADTKVVHCQNCGATTVVDINDIARVCPFCGSPSVETTSEAAGMKPTTVVPFKVSYDGALQDYRSWIKRRFYVPRAVKKNIPNPNLHGIYLPSWTYDADTFSSYNGQFGEHYTVVVGSGKNRHTEIRTRYYFVNGTISNLFDDVLISSSTRLEQQKLDGIAPFNTNESMEYDRRYLVGFSAEHYTIDVKNGWIIAKRKIDDSIKRSIINKYHPDVVSYLNVKTMYNKITYKYVLIPLWLCTYKYKSKEFGFMVNGESGKITGRYPISAGKVIVTILFFILIIMAALLIYSLSTEGNIGCYFNYLGSYLIR
jgi:DNA-directed RNA polymerase subunit RPC12/RpoP